MRSEDVVLEGLVVAKLLGAHSTRVLVVHIVDLHALGHAPILVLVRGQVLL